MAKPRERAREGGGEQIKRESEIGIETGEKREEEREGGRQRWREGRERRVMGGETD